MSCYRSSICATAVRLMLMLGTTAACWPPDFFTLCLAIQQKGKLHQLCPNTVYKPDLTIAHPLFQRCEFWYDETTVQCGEYGLDENCVIDGGDMPFIAPSGRGPMHINFKGITIRNTINTDASVVIQTGNSAFFENCIWENNVSGKSIIVSHGTGMTFKDVIFRNNRSFDAYAGSIILMEADGDVHFQGNACFQNNVLGGQGLVRVGAMASISLSLSGPDCSMNNTVAGFCNEIYLEMNNTCASFIQSPVNNLPSSYPSVDFNPSTYPSYAPVMIISQIPTVSIPEPPSFNPSSLPSVELSMFPSIATFQPSSLPTFLPSMGSRETGYPTSILSETSSYFPSFVPSSSPSIGISSSNIPTSWPSIFIRPSVFDTSQPSNAHSAIPTQIPTSQVTTLLPSISVPSIDPSGSVKPSAGISATYGCVTIGDHAKSHSRHQHHLLLCPPSDLPSNKPSEGSASSESESPSIVSWPSVLNSTRVPSVQSSTPRSSLPSNQLSNYFIPSNAPHIHIHHTMPPGDADIQPHNDDHLTTFSPKASPTNSASASPSSFFPKPSRTGNNEVFLLLFVCAASAASLISLGYIVYKKIGELTNTDDNLIGLERKGKIVFDID